MTYPTGWCCPPWRSRREVPRRDLDPARGARSAGSHCPLGLANVFGQRPSTAYAETSAATLSLYAPTAIRFGDFMEGSFHITARRDLKKAILRLDPGWGEGLSMNTVEPSPISEGSDNGRFSFQLGHIAKGKSYILFMQFQVNRPTSPGTAARMSSWTTATRSSRDSNGLSRSIRSDGPRTPSPFRVRLRPPTDPSDR